MIARKFVRISWQKTTCSWPAKAANTRKLVVSM